MKKTAVYILPVIVVFAGILFVGQFSCSGGGVFAALFGNTGESPLRSNPSTAKAVEIQEAFRNVFSLYKDSVVYITTEQTVKVRSTPFFNDPFLQQFFGNSSSRTKIEKRTGLGTGFILSKDGYICTNYHVAAGVDKIIVGLNGKNYEAVFVGGDEITDVALLKIKAEGDLVPVYFGDSSKVEVGDWAIAIGNPFGLDRTFTVGVVSAVGRHDIDFIGNSHIQTDASINPGNSGGPLINIYGEVIGINRMIYSQSGGYEGIGFAIPINTAREILSQLKEHKRVKRGYLGVDILEISEQDAKTLGLSEAKGVLVAKVASGSPADIGGVNIGDVITDVNGIPIKTYRDLLNVISQASVGRQLKVTVWRKGGQVNLFVTLKERPGM